MDTGLSGKVVLVTGGAGGIGQAISRHFAKEGALVAVHYHTSEDGAEALASEIGGLAVHADLRDPSQSEAMVSRVVSEMGGLDVCVANSGLYPPETRPMWEIGSERWESTVMSNLSVTANTARSFLSTPPGRGLAPSSSSALPLAYTARLATPTTRPRRAPSRPDSSCH